jgi:pimeloyl-ACP methyl ester carboxylesterase
MAERIEYDEFAYFADNASEYGIAYEGPPVVRRESVVLDDGRHVSALVWGGRDPELVLLHGGAQNAHTWDTVALAVGRPLVAPDLPGHGHSDAARTEPSDRITAERHALDVAAAIRQLTSRPTMVVGMSLGGLTAIALAGIAADLVDRLVLVDITPGVTGEKAKAIIDFVDGPATFASFDDLLARTIRFNPTRTESSLRRGILHNAMQLDDGSWIWRYRRHDPARPPAEMADAVDADTRTVNMGRLWETLSNVSVPVMLVRGMRPQSDVTDDDEAELLRRLPNARVEHIADAGHSVQGDTPVELAGLIADFVS